MSVTELMSRQPTAPRCGCWRWDVGEQCRVSSAELVDSAWQSAQPAFAISADKMRSTYTHVCVEPWRGRGGYSSRLDVRRSSEGLTVLGRRFGLGTSLGQQCPLRLQLSGTTLVLGLPCSILRLSFSRLVSLLVVAQCTPPIP